jgi:PPM family protein phosphatase
MEPDTGFFCLNLRPDDDFLASSRAQSPAIDVGSCSDAGRVRTNNEDSFIVAPEMNLFILSDGMGGLASGEVASRLTVDTILTHCREKQANTSRASTRQETKEVSKTSHRLAGGIQLANQVVHRAARESATHRGMGATVVAVWCVKERMSVAHVGDSRAYLLRNDSLKQLTEDHSFVAEYLRLGKSSQDQANFSSLQNVLTRAVGVDPEVDVEISEELVIDGDTVLLCSDGLTRELSNNQIAGILQDAKNSQEGADQLVNLANKAGGGDNITAIVIHWLPGPPGAFSRMGRLGRWFNGRWNQS